MNLSKLSTEFLFLFSCLRQMNTKITIISLISIFYWLLFKKNKSDFQGSFRDFGDMYPMLYFTSFYSSIYYYFFICSFLFIYLFDKIPESFEQLEQILNVNVRTYSSFLNIILVNLEKKKTFWSFNLVNLSGEKSSMLLYISIYKFSLFVCLFVCIQ